MHGRALRRKRKELVSGHPFPSEVTNSPMRFLATLVAAGELPSLLLFGLSCTVFFKFFYTI